MTTTILWVLLAIIIVITGFITIANLICEWPAKPRDPTDNSWMDDGNDNYDND